MRRLTPRGETRKGQGERTLHPPRPWESVILANAGIQEWRVEEKLPSTGHEV